MDDYQVVDGKRVKTSDFIEEETRKGVRRRLDAPYGYKRKVTTPWGAEEYCNVYTMRGPGTEVERMATVYRPKSNPGVAFSTFRID